MPFAFAGAHLLHDTVNIKVVCTSCEHMRHVCHDIRGGSNLFLVVAFFAFPLNLVIRALVPPHPKSAFKRDDFSGFRVFYSNHQASNMRGHVEFTVCASTLGDGYKNR